MKFNLWSSLISLSINETGLSITSFQFNSVNKPSSWVTAILGTDAYFIPSKRNTSDNQMYDNLKYYREIHLLPHETELKPNCSIDILGYVRNDVEEPITKSNRENQPIVGVGILKFVRLSERWKCYYRVVFGWFEMAGLTERELGPSHWPVLFYCIPRDFKKSSLVCKHFNHDISLKRRSIKAQLTMQLTNTTWSNSFTARPRHSLHAHYATNTPRAAVCLVSPYITAITQKVDMNIAMLAEYIRYHTLLGLHVFLYDGSGKQQKLMSNSFYVKARNITLRYTYFNYTLRTLLDPTYKDFTYDSSLLKTSSTQEAMDAEILREKQDLDKTLTITHCRFELQAAYRISRVLVTDSDEFLYCPAVAKQVKKDSNSNSNAYKGNSDNTHIGNVTKSSIVDSMSRLAHRFNEILERDRRVMLKEQLHFPQRWIMPRKFPPLDCMLNNTQHGVSLFKCFGPYKYDVGGQNWKSFYMGHSCPATDFHYSCSQHGYNYMCNCPTEDLMDKCNVIHLSSSPERYNAHMMGNLTTFDLENILHKNCELEDVTRPL